MFPAPPLTVPGVFKTLTEIAAASGAASQARKAGMIVKLLAASKGSEAGYVMRSLQAKLRIGLAEQSVLAALAHAVLLRTKEKEAGEGGEGGGKGKGAALKAGGTALADELEAAAQVVKQAYSECPSYDVVSEGGDVFVVLCCCCVVLCCLLVLCGGVAAARH
jgi:DNA ligase-1